MITTQELDTTVMGGKQPDALVTEQPDTTVEQPVGSFTPPQAPTVATADNPVVEVIDKKEDGMPSADFSDLNSMDTTQLEDFMDALEIKQRSGNVSDEDLLRARKAQRLYQQKISQPTAQETFPGLGDIYSPVVDSQGNQGFVNKNTGQIVYAPDLETIASGGGTTKAPKQTTTPRTMDQVIKEKERYLESEEREASEALRRQIGELEVAEQERLNQEIEGIRSIGQAKQNAMLGRLSFSGFGRSSLAAEKAASIAAQTQAQVNDAAQESLLNIQLQKQLARGASEESLSGIRQQINDLQNQRFEYMTNAIEQTQAANEEASASFDERVNNFLVVAEGMLEPDDLTEDEIALAGDYATLLLDANGDINMKLLDAIPERLRSTAIKNAAMLKGAIPEEPSTVKSGDTTYQYNSETGRYDIPVGGVRPTPGTGVGGGAGTGVGGLPDLTQERAKDNTGNIPFTGNVGNDLNNPGNLVAGGVGDQYAIGTVAVTDKNGVTRNFLVFPNLDAGYQGVRADLEAKMSGRSRVISPTASLSELLDVRVGAEGAGTGYKNTVASSTGYDLSSTISDLDVDRVLDGIRQAEGATGQGVDLSSLAGQQETGYDEADVPLYAKFNAGDLTTADQKNIENFEQFKQKALAYRQRQQSQPDPAKDEMKATAKNLLDNYANKGALSRWIRRGGSEFKTDLKFLRDNLTLDKLVSAKEQGATFGALSETELKMLAASASKLRSDLSREQFQKELKRIINLLGGETLSQSAETSKEAQVTPEAESILDDYGY